MKKFSKFFVPIIFISGFLFFISCKSELPQDQRQGKWIGSCEFGSFGFAIDPTGSKIIFFKDSLKCKAGSHSNSYTFDGGPGSDLTNGEISLVLFAFANLPAVELEGKFYKDGSGTAYASGNIWMFGRNNCVSSWRAEKMK